MTLRTSDFDYTFDAGRIAHEPLENRDAARLMCLDRADGRIAHRVFAELPALLHAGDLLVLNDTRVVPAKFALHRATGGRVDGLFLREQSAGRWQVLLRGAGRCRPGETLRFDADPDVGLRLVEPGEAGQYLVEVAPPAPVGALLHRVGTTPLPPYIRRDDRAREARDRRQYQTVYADRPGAVAAPTAGLHFTDRVLAGLQEAGVHTTRLTLHVGLGTFAPVKTERLAEHPMHAEWYELPDKAAEAVAAARRDGRRVVAVGTTSVRVLESVAARHGAIRPASGWTDLFLYPPVDFRVVDALITNFHLPRSTLLMLVAAFCDPGGTQGLDMILDAYAEAHRKAYRFYSYGDAMLIT
ncbi:MAG: tRNA preQ1(34) S-adenosylmethionine ribosyltransferase-isomerase QueA [Phycisphaerae bacterium]|nr:tRNA preQ1(34) S-adenosylmethionine ribosyltransferase-isomerase QueA [Phycisphaerae bacterium]